MQLSSAGSGTMIRQGLPPRARAVGITFLATVPTKLAPKYTTKTALKFSWVDNVQSMGSDSIDFCCKNLKYPSRLMPKIVK